MSRTQNPACPFSSSLYISAAQTATRTLSRTCGLPKQAVDLKSLRDSGRSPEVIEEAYRVWAVRVHKVILRMYWS